ncbi:hypothetical protein [Acrocarpospora sp. B8E8]|uniref:hypothetical protein n=1 Tax=Acrocarpospora sp. B8E8 TaxID=3153572 RepID=UPI00325C76ED
MPWVRFDDQYPINRKVSRLSDAAYRLHSSAIFWCARNLTDGFVPEEDLEDVCARVRTPERFVTEFLDRGLFHEIGTPCDSESCPANPSNDVTDTVTGKRGWLIHDYFDYQPTKSKVLADRKDNADRQKKWREQQKRGGDRNGVSNPASSTVSNSAPSRPVPSSPNGDEQTDSTSPSRARPRDNGTRLPDDFGVTEDMAAWAREKTPTCGTADHEAFCDYWRAQPGTKGRKADWVATWRNWMRREHDKRVSRPGPPGGNTARRSTTDERVAAAQALKGPPATGDERPHPLIKIMGEIER